MTEPFVVPDRIQRRISPCPVTGCWWWTGFVDRDGYGMASWNGKNRRAHRVLLEIYGRPVPSTLTTDHLCRNRSCVNPDHLEAVDNRTNVLRGVGVSAVCARKTHCIRGHRNWRTLKSGPRAGKRVCADCSSDQQKATYHRDAPDVRHYNRGPRNG